MLGFGFGQAKKRDAAIALLVSGVEKFRQDEFCPVQTSIIEPLQLLSQRHANDPAVAGLLESVLDILTGGAAPDATGLEAAVTVALHAPIDSPLERHVLTCWDRQIDLLGTKKSRAISDALLAARSGSGLVHHAARQWRNLWADVAAQSTPAQLLADLEFVAALQGKSNRVERLTAQIWMEQVERLSYTEALDKTSNIIERYENYFYPNSSGSFMGQNFCSREIYDKARRFNGHLRRYSPGLG